MRAFKGNPNYAAKQKLVSEAKAAIQSPAVALVETDDQDNLSDKQWAAIYALLAGNSLQATADECQINVRTLRRWLNTQEFAEAYHAERHQFMESQAATLQAMVTTATEALLCHLASDNPVVQLRAIKYVNQLSEKRSQNADFKRRLNDLEKANAQQAEQICRLEEENHALRALISDSNETAPRPKEPTKPIEAWMSLPTAENVLQLPQERHIQPQGLESTNATIPAALAA